MRRGHIAVEFEVSPRLTQTFDVWCKRPGLASCGTEWIPGHGWITATGSRRGLRALARELFSGAELQNAYADIRLEWAFQQQVDNLNRDQEVKRG